MWIEYNHVPLKVVDLQRMERVNVYTEDNADLLYVRWYLAAVCTLAPGGLPKALSVTRLSTDTDKSLKGRDDTIAQVRNDPRAKNPTEETLQTEFDFPGQAPPNVWFTGAESDAEIRYRLLKPRCPLRVWAWDGRTGKPIRWLESPRPGFTVDATVGPTPISCDVVAADGEPNSVAVLFQIRTDVTPCPVGSDRFVLSHRWETTHGHDENYYLTRQINGEIIFHAGVRDALGKNPDLVRNQFMHPVPLGMKRQPAMIAQSSDGLKISYTVLDVDQAITFSPGDSGATHIEIEEKMTVVMPRGNEGTAFPT